MPIAGASHHQNDVDEGLGEMATEQSLQGAFSVVPGIQKAGKQEVLGTTVRANQRQSGPLCLSEGMSLEGGGTQGASADGHLRVFTW